MQSNNTPVTTTHEVRTKVIDIIKSKSNTPSHYEDKASGSMVLVFLIAYTTGVVCVVLRGAAPSTETGIFWSLVALVVGGALSYFVSTRAIRILGQKLRKDWELDKSLTVMRKLQVRDEGNND